MRVIYMQELKRLRKKKKISCEDMGNMIGVSKVYYWQLENDKRRLTYDMAVKIAHVFNTKPDSVFYEETKIRIIKS